MAGYTSSKNLVLNGVEQAVAAASPSNQVVSDVFKISENDSKAVIIQLLTSSTVTSIGTTTAKLQTSLDGESWIDQGTASLGAGVKSTYYFIHHNVSDTSVDALAPLGRIVISGTTVTIGIAEIKKTVRG